MKCDKAASFSKGPGKCKESKSVNEYLLGIGKWTSICRGRIPVKIKCWGHTWEDGCLHARDSLGREAGVT